MEKEVSMSNQMKGISLILCVVIASLCNSAGAQNQFHVHLQALETELGLEDQTTVEIYGMADGATGSNGILSWQMDLTADPGLTSGMVVLQGLKQLELNQMEM